jgi:hypothetical protein
LVGAETPQCLQMPVCVANVKPQSHRVAVLTLNVPQLGHSIAAPV